VSIRIYFIFTLVGLQILNIIGIKAFGRGKDEVEKSASKGGFFHIIAQN